MTSRFRIVIAAFVVAVELITVSHAKITGKLLSVVYATKFPGEPIPAVGRLLIDVSYLVFLVLPLGTIVYYVISRRASDLHYLSTTLVLLTVTFLVFVLSILSFQFPFAVMK